MSDHTTEHDRLFATFAIDSSARRVLAALYAIAEIEEFAHDCDAGRLRLARAAYEHALTTARPPAYAPNSSDAGLAVIHAREAIEVAERGFRTGACCCQPRVEGAVVNCRIGLATGAAVVCDRCLHIIPSTFDPTLEV